MKKVLVLAGGVPQRELIRKLQARGYTVLLADYLPNPPAKDCADRFYRESTLDEEKILEIAREEQVELVLTCCTDQALLTVADVSQRLGLPCYLDAETAKKVTNKRYMKSVFAERGIPSAKYRITTDPDPAQFEGFRYPLVVKPVDCNSSKGVRKVAEPQELAEAIAEAKRLSRTHDVIVEEFKQGIELSCDFYVEDGRVVTLSISESQKVRSHEKFVIVRSVYPPRWNPGTAERIREIAQSMAEAFGLRNCPMLMQVIYDKDGDHGRGEISVIEFSARTGGAIKYRLVENLSGVDVIEAVTELSVNGHFHPEPQYRDICLRNEFLYCYDGVLDHVEGLEELKREGVIDEYYLFKTAGDRFTGVNSSGDRVGAITLLGTSLEELRERCHSAVERIRVVSTEGKDLLFRELNQTD